MLWKFLKKPDDWPAMLGWFEMLAGAYIGYPLVVAGSVIANRAGDFSARADCSLTAIYRH